MKLEYGGFHIGDKVYCPAVSGYAKYLPGVVVSAKKVYKEKVRYFAFLRNEFEITNMLVVKIDGLDLIKEVPASECYTRR